MGDDTEYFCINIGIVNRDKLTEIQNKERWKVLA